MGGGGGGGGGGGWGWWLVAVSRVGQGRGEVGLRSKIKEAFREPYEAANTMPHSNVGQLRLRTGSTLSVVCGMCL